MSTASPLVDDLLSQELLDATLPRTTQTTTPEAVSKASLLRRELLTRGPSPQELQERQDAARPRSTLIATTEGTVYDPETQREQQVPDQTLD